MMLPQHKPNRRILIVDDNPAIHADFTTILGVKETNEEFDKEAADFFGDGRPDSVEQIPFELSYASQGQEAYDLVWERCQKERPFALAFVDMRMPPGWDGMETIERLWRVDPDIQCVICTAYSDHALDEIAERLGHVDRFLFLKKPFDAVEIKQMAISLTEKWNMAAILKASFRHVDTLLRQRKQDLEALQIRLELERTSKDHVKARVSKTSKKMLEELGALWLHLHESSNPEELDEMLELKRSLESELMHLSQNK